MPQPLRRVDFVAGKLNETPTGGATVTIIDNIADTLMNAAEASGAMKFNLPANAVDVPLNMGNVNTAKVIVLLTDGAINVKFNGSPVSIPVSNTVVMFATISGILASNPSSSEVRGITLYAATDTN